MQSLQGRSLPYRSRGREQHLFARVFQRGGKFTLLSNTVKPLNQEDFSNLHQAIKNIFSRKENPNVSLPGRWKHFLSNWQRITTNPVILGYVGSYKIPIGEALQDLTPCPSKDDREAKVNCRKGSRRDAEKEAIVQVQSSFQTQYLLLQRNQQGFGPK